MDSQKFWKTLGKLNVFTWRRYDQYTLLNVLCTIAEIICLVYLIDKISHKVSNAWLTAYWLFGSCPFLYALSSYGKQEANRTNQIVARTILSYVNLGLYAVYIFLPITLGVLSAYDTNMYPELWYLFGLFFGCFIAKSILNWKQQTEGTNIKLRSNLSTDGTKKFRETTSDNQSNASSLF